MITKEEIADIEINTIRMIAQEVAQAKIENGQPSQDDMLGSKYSQ